MNTIKITTEDKLYAAELEAAMASRQYIQMDGREYTVEGRTSGLDPVELGTYDIYSCRPFPKMKHHFTLTEVITVTTGGKQVIRFKNGEKVYQKDSDIEYWYIGQSPTSGYSVIENITGVQTVKTSTLTRVKPVVPKDGEIWEVDWMNEIAVVYRRKGKWYTTAKGVMYIMEEAVKPIRKLGEIA